RPGACGRTGSNASGPTGSPWAPCPTRSSRHSAPWPGPCARAWRAASMRYGRTSDCACRGRRNNGRANCCRTPRRHPDTSSASSCRAMPAACAASMCSSATVRAPAPTCSTECATEMRRPPPMYDKDPLSALEALEAAQRLAFAPLAFQASAVLRDRGVLAAIAAADPDEGASIDELATATGLPVYAIRVLLEAGLGLHIVWRR